MVRELKEIATWLAELIYKLMKFDENNKHSFEFWNLINSLDFDFLSFVGSKQINMRVTLRPPSPKLMDIRFQMLLRFYSV